MIHHGSLRNDAQVTKDLLWRQLSAEQLELEYSPSSCIGGHYQPFIDRYRSLSAAAHDAHPAQSFAYGRNPSQSLDLFLPVHKNAPLLIFVHGGYWQELSKAESVFMAPEALRNGIAVASIDYSLAPSASLDEIVSECRAALDWLLINAATLGIDASRIFVSGSSAGAHLAAMMAVEHRLIPLAGAILVSGIYQLEPLIETSINVALKLETASALRNSPMLMNLQNFPQTVIAWGECETEQFKMQSQNFANALRDAGIIVEEMEVQGRNHFDVILALIAKDSQLGSATLGLIQRKHRLADLSALENYPPSQIRPTPEKI